MTSHRALALAGALSWLASGMASAADVAAAPAEQHAARAWRAARWGMAVEDVLKAFPGEAKRLDEPVSLADGNLVAAGIDEYAYGSERFRVRFVFESGKLVLVSLRTPESRYAPPEAYAAVSKQLSAELGGPGEESKDDALIDLRQTRWDVAGTRVDLKYIPGVVVVLYSRSSGAPRTPRAPGADGAVRRPPGPWAPTPQRSP